MRSQPTLPTLTGPDAGLHETLHVLGERRRVLKLFGGLGAVALLPRGALACTLIPTEIAGPFPGDGTNGPNALALGGIVRSDIRSSFGSFGSDVAAGTPVTLTLQLMSTTTDCVPLAGLAVYIWQCDAVSGYSMYTDAAVNENYLRGVQVSDAEGKVVFVTVYPGCYAGRWPHLHIEVFASLAAATNGNAAVSTSQIALPESTSRDVYAQASLYPGSTGNLDNITLATDISFSDDDGVTQTPTMTGDNAAGYAAFLEVGVALDPQVSDDIFVDGFDDAAA